MQFSDLYTTELDRCLGTSKTDLFTTVRRKAAINAAQLEWVKRTECLQRQADVSLVDGTQEYDLEVSISDFGWIAKQGISIKVVDGSTTTYIEGDELTRTTVERLNTEEPGWRAATAGTPSQYYVRRQGGAVNLGFYVAPDFDGATVTCHVPCVIVTTDMSADADVPFTYSGNAIASLRFWHRALAYFGAMDCEQYRKDVEREAINAKKWEAAIEEYLAAQVPKTGRTVRYAHDYRRRGARRPLDPMVYP